MLDSRAEKATPQKHLRPTNPQVPLPTKFFQQLRRVMVVRIQIGSELSFSPRYSYILAAPPPIVQYVPYLLAVWL